MSEREHTPVVVVNETSGEVEYFLTSGTASLAVVLAAAFRLWAVGYAFRLDKQEVDGRISRGRATSG